MKIENLYQFESLLWKMWFPDSQVSNVATREYLDIPEKKRELNLLATLSSGLEGLIWRAAFLLLRDHYQSSSASVRTLLESPNHEVRRVALLAYGETGVEGVARVLERLALTDTNTRVRETATWALSTCGDKESIQVLEKIQRQVSTNVVGETQAEIAGETLAAIRK